MDRSALAQKNASSQVEILQAIKSISKAPVRSSQSQQYGFAVPLLDYITSKVDVMSRGDVKTRLRQELLSVVQQDEYSIGSDDLTSSMGHSRLEALQDKILQSLAYPGMEDREGGITEAFGKTFQWIFEDSPHNDRKWGNFKDWLQSDEQLYWITGKAGSGKSTLMKYISEISIDSTTRSTAQPRCIEHLRTWARESKLILATFYFWHSGIPLQNTQEGLFRTLLFQILKQHRDLIAAVCPQRLEAIHLFTDAPTSWKTQELGATLAAVTRVIPDEVKLCLFVDGLDEFSGNHRDLITVFRTLVLGSTSGVKLCVASRPWVEFQDAFRHDPSLMLQDLTYSDRKHYVASHMEIDEGFQLLCSLEPAFGRQLIENITIKSEGVFLWVRLVVASLLGGMNYGDRVSDLQRRLDALPSELEELYDRMLASLDPFYLEHAAQLFKFVQTSFAPPMLLVLTLADEEDCLTTALAQNRQLMSLREISNMHEAMRRRINSRCKGMLEVNTTKPQPKDMCELFTVQYLHKTVKDYIESPDVQRKLSQASKSPYDASLRHCIGLLRLIKARPVPPVALKIDDVFWRAIDTFMRHAVRVTSQNKSVLFEVMNELDRSCNEIYLGGQAQEQYGAQKGLQGQRAIVESNPHASVHWLCFHPGGEVQAPYNGHVLSLALRYGAYDLGSLSRIISQDWLVSAHQAERNSLRFECASRPGMYPLLLDAITWASDSRLPSNVPNLDAIKFLLQNGADPNCALRGYLIVPLPPPQPRSKLWSPINTDNTPELMNPNFNTTVWQVALSVPPGICFKSTPSGAEELEWRKWLKTYKLFLAYGAGTFSETERYSFQADIDFMLQLFRIEQLDWQHFIRKLRQGAYMPEIYHTSTEWHFELGGITRDDSAPEQEIFSPIGTPPPTEEEIYPSLLDTDSTTAPSHQHHIDQDIVVTRDNVKQLGPRYGKRQAIVGSLRSLRGFLFPKKARTK
jgi:energy-coupling factor transporter ATP-binding protein EcfA2